MYLRQKADKMLISSKSFKNNFLSTSILDDIRPRTELDSTLTYELSKAHAILKDSNGNVSQQKVLSWHSFFKLYLVSKI